MLLTLGIGGAGDKRPRESVLELGSCCLNAGVGGSRDTRGELLLVMMLSTMDAVLGRNDDGRDDASRLSGRAASFCLSVRGSEPTIGASEF